MAGHTLVVGGTKGIGRAVARRLAEDGQVVSVVGRTPPSGSPEHPQIRFWASDVADSGHFKAVLDQIVDAQGPLSAAVLLQRYRGGGDDWTGEFATSLTATRDVLEWAAERFEDRGSGKAVVVISSI